MKNLSIWLLALTLTLGVSCKKETIKKDAHANIKGSVDAITAPGKVPGNHVMNPVAEPGGGGSHSCAYESTYDNYQWHHPCLYYCRCTDCVRASTTRQGDVYHINICEYYSPFHN